MIKMSGDDLVQRLLVDDEILTQMVWETPLSLIGLLLWLALGGQTAPVLTGVGSFTWMPLPSTPSLSIRNHKNRSHRPPFPGHPR
jgi:hypothetical protein